MAKKPRDPFSLKANEKAVSSWLSGARSLSVKRINEGVVSASTVRKLLTRLCEADSAFLSNDGGALIIHVYKHPRGPLSHPVDAWRIEKLP